MCSLIKLYISYTVKNETLQNIQMHLNKLYKNLNHYEVVLKYCTKLVYAKTYLLFEQTNKNSQSLIGEHKNSLENRIETY